MLDGNHHVEQPRDPPVVAAELRDGVVADGDAEADVEVTAGDGPHEARAERITEHDKIRRRMLRTVVADDAVERIGGFFGLARLPEKLERVEADHVNTARGQLIRDCNIEPGPAAVAGQDHRNALRELALRRHLDQRQVGDIRGQRLCARRRRGQAGDGVDQIT